ncbi:MAG: DUF5615 family PIN-like protein [Bacteroidota bacterium]
MDKVVLLADESVDFRVVKRLRRNGYNVDAIIEFSAGADDQTVLDIARERQIVLLTEDKDFGELTYRLNKASYGIILLRLSTIDIDDRVDLLIKLLNEKHRDLRSSFVVIKPSKTRIIPLK